MSMTSRPVISRRRVDSSLMACIAYIGAFRCNRRIGFGTRRRGAAGGDTTLALRLRRRNALLSIEVAVATHTLFHPCPPPDAPFGAASPLAAPKTIGRTRR